MTVSPRARSIRSIQPGYAIGERVLRPALVGVSSGTQAAANDQNGRVASRAE